MFTFGNNPDFSQHSIVDVDSSFGYYGTMGEFEEYMIAANKSVYNAADFQRGMRILKAYHNAASSSDNYKLTFDQFLDAVVRNSPAIGPRTKSYDILVAGIGEQPTILGKSEAWAIDTVETLAYNGDGMVPKSYFTLEAAMRENAINNPSWAEAAQYVAVNTIKDVAAVTGTVLQATGDTIVGVAKMSKYIIPAAVIGAGIIGFLVLKKRVETII